MARRERRDYVAEYRARKARAAAEGTTVFRRRNAEARRVGYSGYGELRRRRKSGDLTHADTAAQAARADGAYVTNMGGGRWTWATPDRGIQPLTAGDRARLAQTLTRASRVDSNATITADWYHPQSGRRGTAQAGGDYGVRVRRIWSGGDGDAALAAVEAELRNAVGSALPPGAIVTSLNLYLFPSAGRAAA